MKASGGESIVTIPFDQALEIARDLECFVVSLDRIASRNVEDGGGPEVLSAFMYDWLVGYRLARARGVLWDAVAEVIGEEAVEEIAEALPRFPDAPPEDLRQLREEFRAARQRE